MDYNEFIVIEIPSTNSRQLSTSRVMSRLEDTFRTTVLFEGMMRIEQRELRAKTMKQNTPPRKSPV